VPHTASLGLAAVMVALTACGPAQNERAGSTDSLEAPPPIEAIDEPADGAFLFGDGERERLGVSEPEVWICVGKDRRPDEKSRAGSCEPTPEEAREFQETMQEYRESVRPAPGVAPRAIARLRLDRPGGAKALLIAWRAQSGKLCLAHETREPDGGSSGGPSGPCMGDHPTCPDLCLSRSGGVFGREVAFELLGVVAAHADELRIDFEDGRTARYPLAGPLVPGFPDSRVFMLDLGNSLYKKVELLAGGKVIADEKIPESELCLWKSFPLSDHDGADALSERCGGRGDERFFGDRVE
jgi:hypothetical protein